MTKKIFFDKGHGGSDPGAVGNGLQEKTLTHKIVEYAVAYLASNYTGYEVKESRPGDEARSLDQRTDDANKWGADVLISVHINSAANTAANGFESFVYPNVGASTVGLQNMLHSEVMQAMKAYGINNDRGKKQANFHMLRESKMVACLTENLFIVNKGDSERLKNETFLKAVGEAHARGVAKYLGLPSKPKPKPVAKPKTDKLYRVQVGAFADRDNAKGLVEELKGKGYSAFITE
jgi:N-acetylmuramoyl-L-alanine amidase